MMQAIYNRKPLMRILSMMLVVSLVLCSVGAIQQRCNAATEVLVGGGALLALAGVTLLALGLVFSQDSQGQAALQDAGHALLDTACDAVEYVVDGATVVCDTIGELLAHDAKQGKAVYQPLTDDYKWVAPLSDYTWDNARQWVADNYDSGDNTFSDDSEPVISNSIWDLIKEPWKDGVRIPSFLDSLQDALYAGTATAEEVQAAYDEYVEGLDSSLISLSGDVRVNAYLTNIVKVKPRAFSGSMSVNGNLFTAVGSDADTYIFTVKYEWPRICLPDGIITFYDPSFFDKSYTVTSTGVDKFILEQCSFAYFVDEPNSGITRAPPQTPRHIYDNTYVLFLHDSDLNVCSSGPFNISVVMHDMPYYVFEPSIKPNIETDQPNRLSNIIPNIYSNLTDSSTKFYIGTVENNTVTEVYETNIFNEETNIFIEPETNVTYNISDWTYDYSTRTYVCVDTDGNTCTVQYGDDAVYVTVPNVNGGTSSYIYHYIMQNSSSYIVTGIPDIVDNPAYDFLNESTGKRSVAIPLAIPDASVCPDITIPGVGDYSVDQDKYVQKVTNPDASPDDAIDEPQTGVDSLENTDADSLSKSIWNALSQGMGSLIHNLLGSIFGWLYDLITGILDLFSGLWSGLGDFFRLFKISGVFAFMRDFDISKFNILLKNCWLLMPASIKSLFFMLVSVTALFGLVRKL